MRELFVEELTQVRGGADPCCKNTTDACCEEGPFDGCCGWWDHVEDLIKIEP